MESSVATLSGALESLTDGGCRGRGFSRLGNRSSRHIDAAVQDGTLLDVQSWRLDVPFDDAGRLDLDSFRRDEIALDLTDHDDRFGADLRRQVSIRAHRELMILEIDVALDSSVDFEILVARQFTLENDGLTDHGH